MSFLNNLFKSNRSRQSIDKEIQNALTLLQEGNFLEALEQLEEKRGDPGLTQYETKELLLGLAECYFKRLLNLRGRDVANHALPICKRMDDSFGIGICSYYLNNYSGAIPALSKAIKTPNIQKHVWKHGKSLITLGHCYYSTGKKKQALDFYQQAIQACSKAKDQVGEAETHLWLGLLSAEALLHAGIREAGTRNKAFEASKDIYAPSNFALLCLTARGKKPLEERAVEAYNHLKTTVEFDEGTEDYLTLGFAYRTLAWLDLLHGDLTQGEKHILRAAENFDKLENTFYAGVCYFALGLAKKDTPIFLLDAVDLFGKAAKSYESVETPSPLNIGNAYLQQAHCILNLSQVSKAASTRQHPLFSIPDMSAPLVKQAQQAYEKSIMWFEKDIGRGLSSLGPAELNLGKCLMLQGKVASARDHFKKAEKYYLLVGRMDMAGRASELARQAWGK